MLERALRPLVISELKPPMNISLVTDEQGLEELNVWLLNKATVEVEPMVGIDFETNVVHDFYYRFARTLQIGDKHKQFVIDLLALCNWNTDLLTEVQGHYGAHVEKAPLLVKLFSIIDPVVCTNKFLKVGQNLGFEYSVFNWNFGRRIWHLYSTDMAERVIKAGTIALKKMAEFSMAAIVARLFGVIVDKTEQETFDLKTPLTQKQIEYAAFDIRMPFAIREAQVNAMTADQLLTVAQIENDAIGTFVDMHLVGQNLDDERWLKRIEKTIEERKEQLRTLDEGFIPIVGRKNEQIDEEEISRRYKKWKEDFEKATPEEMRLAALKRDTKDKIKKAELGEILKAEEQKRKDEKAKARTAHSELSKVKTKTLKIIDKCAGEAFLNYGSQPQLMAALQKLPGMKHISDTTDDTLLRFNDRPLIQTLRKFRKGMKGTGTYGVSWTQRWITKASKEEGWRHPWDGRLHCIFNQLMAETGRTSSEKPNGQNLPKDPDVRACFICDPPNENIRISLCCEEETTKCGDGVYVCNKCKKLCETKPEEYCIITIDMSGAELRIIAVLANARSWIEAFNKGWDVHSVSTEILYPEKWPSLTEPGCAYFALDDKGQPKRKKCKCKGHIELRDGTKAVNFLLCYGGGADALADALGVTLDAAKELMALHEKKFPDVWSFLRQSGLLAVERKEARDMYGRRRSFPDPTWQDAKEFFIEYNEERLELSDEQIELQVFNFKAKNLREPNKEELWKLSHREPTTAEIGRGMWGLKSRVERQGKNHPIQGTNASMIKRAMGCGFDKDGKPYLWHTLLQFKARIQAMIHDELLIHCPLRFAEKVAALAGDAFKRAAAEVMKDIVIMENDYHINKHWEK